MAKNKWRLSLALPLIVALALSACVASTPVDVDGDVGEAQAQPAAETAPQASEGEKVVRVQTSQGKGTYFNPLYWIGTGSQYHSFMWIWPALTRSDDAGQQLPNLAESFEASPDALTWTFHLPENATWSDGTPMTAEDVLFSYERKLDPEFMTALGLPWAPGWHATRLGAIQGLDAFMNGEAESIEGITAPDEHTVLFELAEPNAVLPIGTQHIYTLPKHILGDLSAEEYGQHPYVTENPDVVLGPFRLARYEVDEFIELERNPEWWGAESPNIDRLVLYQSAPDAHLNRMLAGEEDVIYVGSDEMPLIEESPYASVETVDSLGWLSLVLNERDRPYMTQEVRQAIAYAIDRDVLNSLLFEGEGVEPDSLILGPEWAIPDGLNPYDRDLDRARELLESVDWDFERQLVLPSTDPEDVLAPVLQQMLGEAGIQVEIRLISYTDVANILSEGDYDLWVSGGGSAGADPSLAGSYVRCVPDGYNQAGYCNPELDELFSQGVSYSTIEERQPYYYEAAQILNEELPFIAHFRARLGYAVSDRLQNFVPAASLDDLTWNLMEWDVEE